MQCAIIPEVAQNTGILKELRRAETVSSKGPGGGAAPKGPRGRGCTERAPGAGLHQKGPGGGAAPKGL